MEEHSDLYNLVEFMNLTGQQQPSGLPDISDSLLNDQILGDIVFTEEDLALHSIMTNNDDISNALIDAQIDQFPIYDLIITDIPASPCENDDITKLISSPFEEVPRQSIIEDTMERMTLIQSQTDILSSPSSVQIGSSPVEHKEIDNSILASKYVQQQHRIYKNASKAKKSSKHQQPSSNVGPIDILSTYGGCQPCTTERMYSDFEYQQQILQFDSKESKTIQFKCQPRSKFRPRTQNECKAASHYIRCELNNEHEYPTIYIPHTWALQSVKNLIEVALVGIDGQPHPYTIDNKTCSTTFDDNTLIFRQNECNTLYFCLTSEDFKNGYKTFMIEFIKSKQDDIITKDLIKTRQLDQSMLRFTRIYQDEKDTYKRDENSTAYSCVMSEAYGDVCVEHMGPTYGPMCGNERVYTLLKGRILKDDITVFLTETQTGWHQQLPFIKNGNLVYFSMPSYPFPRSEQAIANITIFYKGEELYQSSYLYKGSLDQALAQLNINDSTSSDNDSSASDAFNFFSATGACPVRASSRKLSTAKSTKRLKNK